MTETKNVLWPSLGSFVARVWTCNKSPSRPSQTVNQERCKEIETKQNQCALAGANWLETWFLGTKALKSPLGSDKQTHGLGHWKRLSILNLEFESEPQSPLNDGRIPQKDQSGYNKSSSHSSPKQLPSTDQVHVYLARSLEDYEVGLVPTLFPVKRECQFPSEKVFTVSRVTSWVLTNICLHGTQRSHGPMLLSPAPEGISGIHKKTETANPHSVSQLHGVSGPLVNGYLQEL